MSWTDDTLRGKNIRVLTLSVTLLGAMTGLVAYSPYQMFCDLTGYGGTVQRAVAKQPSVTTTDETVKVHFDANVAPGLPWEFRPEQRSVETRFGEPTRVYYYAENKSDETIVAARRSMSPRTQRRHTSSRLSASASRKKNSGPARARECRSSSTSTGRC